jgi:hypothetical protein
MNIQRAVRQACQQAIDTHTCIRLLESLLIARVASF